MQIHHICLDRGTATQTSFKYRDISIDLVCSAVYAMLVLPDCGCSCLETVAPEVRLVAVATLDRCGNP